ncbi:MAG TPA: hypothetical protein VE890_03480, partial [Thermoguttaceae bacterium]|nr:hypothetical protein [Thermoguttaceae bacterium]
MTRTLRLLTALMILLGFATSAVTRAEESAQGTPAIAAWDVVPHQIIAGPFVAGVVAFHETGCRVEFTVVQPPPSTADAIQGAATQDAVKQRAIAERATQNERTGVWEYCLTVDPAALDDGPFAVLASAVPLGRDDASTALAPLPLVSNADGSLRPNAPVWTDCDRGSDDTGDGTEAKPLKTIRRAIELAGDGGSVYLKPGKGYSADRLGGGKQRTFWTTIAAAPGVSRDEIEIGHGRPGTDKLRFNNVTLYA